MALGLLGLTWAAYHAATAGYFLRDDWMWLFDARRQLADPSLLWTWRPSGYFRPLSNTVFTLEHAAFGLQPTGYLVVAILLHAWNASWIFALARRLFQDTRCALAAAALFAVLQHPAAAVMWISSLVTLLAAAAILPAATLYLRNLQTSERWCYWASLGCTALALGAKESGVLVFPLIAILDLRERGQKTLYGGGTWMRWAGFAALAVIYWRIQSEFFEGAALERGHLDLADAALGTASGVVANFPALYSPVAEATPLLRRVGLGMVLILGVIVFLVWTGGKQRWRDALTALAITAAGFAPFVLFLSYTDVLTGRYAYLASVGAALTFGLFFSSLQRAALGWKGHRAAWVVNGLAGLFIVLHIVGTNITVRSSPRYAAAMEDSRRLAESVRDVLSEAQPGERWLFVAAPVENVRHLACLVSVVTELPLEATREQALDLRPAEVRARMSSGTRKYLQAETAADRIAVWRDGAGLVPWTPGRGEAELRDALVRNRRGTNARTLQPRVHLIEVPRAEERLGD